MSTIYCRFRPAAAFLLLSLFRSAQAADIPLLRIEPGGHTAAVRQILFTPDGSKLVSVGIDKVVRIWDLGQGTQIGRGLRYPVGAGPWGGIYAAGLANDGRIAIGGYDVRTEMTGGGELGGRASSHAYLRLLDPGGGSMQTIETPHQLVITSIAFSSDGKLMASGSSDRTAIVWDAASMKPGKPLASKDVVSAVAFSPDGAQLATGSYDRSVRIWDARAGRLVREIPCNAPVQCVAWSPDGATIAAGCMDSRVRLLDPASGKVRNTLNQRDNPTCLAFSPDSSRLLSGSGESKERNDRTVRVWSLPDGAVVREYSEHAATVLAVAFSPTDPNVAASADLAGVIRLWNPRTGQTISKLKGTGASVFSVGWSADGKSVAWGNGEEGALQFGFNLYEAAPGPTVKPAEQGQWRRGETAQNGRTLRIENPPPGAVNQLPAVIVVGGGRDVRLQNPREPNDRINAATFAPSGQVVVASDFGLAVYSAAGGAPRMLRGHTGSVLDVAVSPDGAYLASASADQTVRIWSLKAARPDAVPLLSLFPATDGTWVAWCEQGFYAASPRGDDIIGWQIDHGQNRPSEFRSAYQMHATYYRPDVVSRLLEAGSIKEAIKRAADAQRRPPTEVAAAAETALKLPTAEILEVGPAARQGDAWVSRQQAVKIRVRVANLEPADSISVRVNRPATTKRLAEATAAPRPDERILDATLLPGDNILTVVAKNRAGESQPVTAHVTWEAPEGQRKAQNLSVLAVGVSDYDDASIPSLHFAHNDAREIAAFYGSQPGRLFSTVHVTRLTNREATRKSVLSALDSVARSAGPDDTVILFVSSHGFEENGAFYFALSDAKREKLAESGIDWQDVLRRLGALSARNVILVVDQCYSGGVAKELIRGYRPANEAMRSVREANILTFAASTSDQVSYEDSRWQHGAFTFALLKALRGQAVGMQYPDHMVLLSKAADYVVDAVERLVQDALGARQIPSLFALPDAEKRIPIAHVP